MEINKLVKIINNKVILTSDLILAEVKFEPALDEFQVNPHSIDLRLAEQIILMPGITVLAKSQDKVTLPGDIAAVVFPRSSTNRRYITLDITGIVDANYSGTLTLPLRNTSQEPILLMKGERVASLVFYRLEKQAVLRLSKYHNSEGNYIPDKGAEAALLAKGDLEGLKAKFALSQPE